MIFWFKSKIHLPLSDRQAEGKLRVLVRTQIFFRPEAPFKLNALPQCESYPRLLQVLPLPILHVAICFNCINFGNGKYVLLQTQGFAGGAPKIFLATLVALHLTPVSK